LISFSLARRGESRDGFFIKLIKTK